MSPLPVAVAPVPALEPAAAEMARAARERLGVEIVLDGQDWGESEDVQLENIGAVISAVERLPERVSSSVVASPDGTVAVLSNRQGLTLGGWQPYGNTAISFYTNSDQGPEGNGPSDQVVLATGSSIMVAGHELLHAYQFRGMKPGEYVLALLGDEMRSFMAATGWRQVASDARPLTARRQSWTRQTRWRPSP
jgi:hypothetical protein